MKLLGKHFEKDSSGSVHLVPEEAEDMWHAYNLIAVGDRLRSTTIRRVQQESATGSTSSSKVRTTLTIQVENIDFDTQACVLRVKGRNVEENQYVKMGQYHTLDLELNRKFSIMKDNWDYVAIERIESACDPSQSADLAAVIMQEGMFPHEDTILYMDMGLPAGLITGEHICKLFLHHLRDISVFEKLEGFPFYVDFLMVWGDQKLKII